MLLNLREKRCLLVPWTEERMMMQQECQIAGWPDPLVHQNVSMGFAFPSNNTPPALYGAPLEQLDYADSPLIFSYSLDTGVSAKTKPYNVFIPFQHPSLRKYL